MKKQNQTNKTTYTPGPWDVKVGLKNKSDIGIYGTNSKGRHRIATIFCNEASPDPNKSAYFSNARLIAAAPDLLEACKDLLKFIVTLHPQTVMEQQNKDAARRILDLAIDKTRPTGQTELVAVLKKAAWHLTNGDPVEAVSVLKMALAKQMDLDTRKQIGKARDEADIGNPATAETLLAMLIDDL